MNSNEDNELTPFITQPSATTRRGFIKRTASAAMVATLALGAFKNEALAETAEGSSHHYELELSGWPQANITYSEPSGYQEIEFGDIEVTTQNSADGYTWVFRTVSRVTPNSASNTLIDGAYHYIAPECFSVSSTITISVWNGTTLIGTNSGGLNHTLGATIENRSTGTVEGHADIGEGMPLVGVNLYPAFGGNSYRLHYVVLAQPNNPDPLANSVSPTVGIQFTLSRAPNEEGGSEAPLFSVYNSVSFTWSSFRVEGL